MHTSSNHVTMTIIKRVDQVSVKEEVVIDEVHTSLMTGSAEWNKMKSNGTVRYSTSHLIYLLIMPFILQLTNLMLNVNTAIPVSLSAT